MWYLIVFIVSIVILYIFPWVIGLLTYIFWFLFNVLILPIELINTSIYPVWSIVYVVYYILFAYLIYEFVLHTIMWKK